MRAPRGAAAAALALALASPLRRAPAQQPDSTARPPAPAPASSGPEVIDRIAAVVGQRVILSSEIDEEINQRRSAGLQIPQDSAGLQTLRHQVLNDLVDDEVLYERARRDTTINVADAEVQGAVEQQYRQVRGQFHTDQEFRTALAGAGLGTPEEYRRWLTDKQRRSAYQQRYIQKLQSEGKLHPGTISDQDLRRAYQQALASSQHRPPSISFAQVVVAPRPTQAARAAARAKADSVQLALERGADFSTAARRFSDDPTTKDNGGDLGWFRRGQMVRAFEDVAFALRPGVISPVVETPFGYHIMIVDRILPAEVKARHILFAPAVTDSDIAAARRLADSVAALIRGGANADSLARLYGDSTEPRTVSGADRTQLQGEYAQALAGVQGDSVVGPFQLDTAQATRTRFVVARVTDVQPEREYTFEEVREQVRLRLVQERGVRNLLDDLRRHTYVDLRL